MSAHKNLDDDLQHPPPSAQRAPAASRPIARHQHHAYQPTFAIDPIPVTTARHEHNPRFFDAWNSSSTGHQRAENRLSGSTSWRQSRNVKLGEQYKGGLSGGKRVSDTVGAGSVHFGKDGRKSNDDWERGASGLRDRSQKSLAEFWSGVGRSKESEQAAETSKEVGTHRGPDEDTRGKEVKQDLSSELNTESSLQSSRRPKPIFEGLCFYLNGSTAPLISDHHLKHLLSLHGGSHSISLTRRTVTHCILGKACGGGLSASKMEKEIARTKKKGVRFVTADWVLSSVKADRRLPESNFSVQLAPKTQTSIVQQSKKPISS